MPPLHFRARSYLLLGRHAGFALAAFLAVSFLTSVLALRGGALRPEEYFLLPHYLDGQKPLLARVFDVASTDAGAYQARELSHFFDLVNASVIAWGVDHGRPHFLSICHYVFCGATVAFSWWFMRRRLALPRPVAAAIAAIFLATPMAYFGASYFPSAKSGAAAALAACMCCVAPAFSPVLRRVPLGAWLGTFLATLVMGLFDRQGFFFGLLLFLVLLIQAWVARDRRSLIWLAAPLLALLSLELNNRLLTPALIEYFDGYRPSFEFQQLPLGALWSEPGTGRDTLLYGPLLMLDDARFLLGCMPVFAAGALLAAAVWWLGPAWPWPDRVAREWSPGRRSAAGRLLLALLPVALAAMNGLMVLRMKSVAGLDFRRVYYGLPSVVLLTIALACAVAVVRRRRLLPARWILPGLLGLLACNAVALLEHRQIVRTGLYRDSFYGSPALLTALQHLERVPAANAQPPYWPTFVSGRTPVEQDGIVRFFRRRQLLQSGKPVPAP